MSYLCTWCGTEKQAGDFYARKDRPGSLQPGCRPCRAAYAKARAALASASINSISPADVVQAYDFNASTGEFVPKAGAANPYIEPGGYLTIRLCGRRVMAHRVAWFMYYGRWPSGQVDHINHVRTDNRRENLRDVPAQENAKNTGISKRNKSGVVGVSWYEARQRWVAQIGIKREGRSHTLMLGHFDELTAAVAARKRAERELGYHENHGAKNAAKQEA